MPKLDWKREYQDLYLPSAKRVSQVDVPEFQFAMLDGVIAADETPGSSASFENALACLYGISYGLRFISKLREKKPIDYTVMALEALWWVDSGAFDFGAREPWYFRAMIMQPDHIDYEMFETVRIELAAKKPHLELSELRLERFEEEPSIQVMHIGPYAEERRTLAMMEAYLQEHGLKYRGDHHEIYLGDPRRAKPENLRTVLRHAVEPSAPG